MRMYFSIDVQSLCYFKNKTSKSYRIQVLHILFCRATVNTHFQFGSLMNVYSKILILKISIKVSLSIIKVISKVNPL